MNLVSRNIPKAIAVFNCSKNISKITFTCLRSSSKNHRRFANKCLNRHKMREKQYQHNSFQESKSNLKNKSIKR